MWSLMLMAAVPALGITQKHFDCKARQLAYSVAKKRLLGQLNVEQALGDVHDALRLSRDCNVSFMFDLEGWDIETSCGERRDQTSQGWCLYMFETLE